MDSSDDSSITIVAMELQILIEFLIEERLAELKLEDGPPKSLHQCNEIRSSRIKKLENLMKKLKSCLNPNWGMRSIGSTKPKPTS